MSKTDTITYVAGDNPDSIYFVDGNKHILDPTRTFLDQGEPTQKLVHTGDHRGQRRFRLTLGRKDAYFRPGERYVTTTLDIDACDHPITVLAERVGTMDIATYDRAVELLSRNRDDHEAAERKIYADQRAAIERIERETREAIARLRQPSQQRVLEDLLN